MPAKVVDASALGAITFGEPEAERALLLLEDCDIVAPHLLAYELTSIARTKIKRIPDQRRAIEKALRDSLSLDIRWVEVDHLQVLALALEVGLSSYDASYLHVARTLDLPLVTFDDQLAKAAISPT
jgi:predicted nucleic acid-binding protein